MIVCGQSLLVHAFAEPTAVGDRLLLLAEHQRRREKSPIAARVSMAGRSL